MAFEGASVTQELLSDKVYGLVRRAILDGTQAPGSRLVESEIARSLGVSQAPVRDAIKRLGHEGLVTSLPRRHEARGPWRADAADEDKAGVARRRHRDGEFAFADFTLSNHRFDPVKYAVP